MPIKSVLKQAIKQLPDSMKAESVTPALLKKGVKKEELEFSGLQLPGKGKVTRDELLGLEQQREDMFYTTEVDPHYQSVSLPGGQANPTYREKVLRFEKVSEADTRYTSQHFPDVPNYLAHTRIYDEDFDGTPTRVLQEIQSDLHQTGRQYGYATDKQPEITPIQKAMLDDPSTAQAALDDEYFAEEMFGVTPEELKEAFDQLATRTNLEPRDLASLSEEEILQEVKEASTKGIPKSPYEKNWLTKSIERELSDAVDEGRQQLAIPIVGKDAGNLKRAEGVQKWYETQVVNTAKKVAKKAGMDFSLEDVNGTQYATIKPKLDSKPNFTLYSTPTAGAFATYTAYKNGYTEDQVTQYLSERGYDEEEIAELNQTAEKIAQAEAAGYSREEIEEYLQGQELTTKVEVNEPAGQADLSNENYYGGLGVPRRMYRDVKKEAYDRVLDEETLTASQLVSNLQVLQPTMVSDTMTSIPAFFGNKEALQRYNVAREASRSKIIDIAKRDYGIDLIWEAGDVGAGQWFVQTEQGLTEVTPDFWQDLKSEKGEIAGGIAGGIAGFKYAPANPYVKVAGTTIGAVSGAIAGAQIDYLSTAMEMQMDMDAEVAAHKAMNAGEIAIVGEVIGYPVAKSLGAGWKGVLRAKNMVMDGNSKGAYQALKEIMFMSDDEIDEIVTRFEKLAGPLDGDKEQKAITAVTLGERGMQDLVRVAGAIDPKASRAVIKSVDDRAQELLKTTADLTSPEVSRSYIKDLQNYVGDVKGYYDAVKAKAVQSPRGLNFDWDYDELAIEPVLERLSSKITDPMTSQKFLLQAQRIRSFSESRNFGDLIEFRQIVNDFLYNKRIAKADDRKMLRGIINNIDGAIEDGAQYVVENPKEWLDAWATARLKYTEMKKVEQTALYKMVFDKKGNVRPVQPETVVKGLTKYIGALDGSFEEVMSQIPAKGRGAYESAVVDHLANKFTAGTSGGMRAVNFPMLAEELQKVNFTTPGARSAKKAILEMSDVFKNDVYLAQASGKIEIPKFQSYLTTDPVVRAKFELASGVFNYLKTWAPGSTQRNFALVKQAAKLLEQPLNAKTSKELMKEVAGDESAQQAIRQLQQEAARAKAAGRDLGGARVLVDSNNKLVNSVSQAAKKIPAHRIASEEVVKQVADREALTVDSPILDKVLKQYGYVAVSQGSDRLRMLGDK